MVTDDSASASAVLELLDKQAIYENMMFYIRGQDRKDLELVKSTFWPDATEDHGAFVGSAHDFCDLVHERSRTTRYTAVHNCGNVLIEMLGDQAKRETVFTYVRVETERTIVLSGRYRDLCEKRRGQWKVLRRLVIFEWVQTLPPNGDYWEIFGYPSTASRGTIYPDDPIYHDWNVLSRIRGTTTDETERPNP
ncbi:hypothetical protein AZG88_38970 [Rhodococcus sp. LB1]|nr:hypothetical protein AZG88_38970 [Rhodococcus sp. LB1]